MKTKVIFSLILFLCIILNVVQAQPLQGSFESIYQRYQKGQQFSGTPIRVDNTTAWKNERVYSHIVLWSQTNQHNLSYEVSKLTNLTDSIPAEAIQLLFAHPVTADRYARNCGTYPSPRMDSVEIADALSFTPITSVAPEDPLKIWVRVNVPENIAAGMYAGTIQVKQNGSEKLTFNLHVEVLEKKMPDRTNWKFHLDLWQYPYQLLKYYNLYHPASQIELWSASHLNMVKPLYQLLADAGQKAISVYLTDNVIEQPTMVKWILKADKTWEYDFSSMDAWIDMLSSLGISEQINCFSTIGMGVDSLTYYDESSREFKKLYMPMFTPTYYERWNDFLTALKTHLNTRHLFDKTVIYLDEVPSEDLSQLNSLIHGHDPAWKIGLAYFHPLTQVESSYMYDITGNLGFATSENREGKISTFYTSCAQTIPNTYVTLQNSIAEAAWLAWHSANKNLNGFLRWAYDFWTLPHPLNVQDGNFTSGENSLVYRSSNELNAEIYTSYRMEILRKGIQDFEKIKILEAELQSSTDPVDREALQKLNEKISQFHENSGSGATALIQEGSKLLNDIVRGDFSACRVIGADSTIAYTQWLDVRGSSTSLGNTWVDKYPGGYSHYTAGKITAFPGNTLTLTVENSSASSCARSAVWIDWNENNDFEDNGELVWCAGSANSCDNATSNTFDIIVPTTVKSGVKRMRIQVRDSYVDAPSPCGDVSSSSTRDFDLVVADTYCQPLTHYNQLYYLKKVSTLGRVENSTCVNESMPLLGYSFDDKKSWMVEKGTSFLLNVENSELSKCARTAIWVDWNQNGSFEDEGELIALLGEANSCSNPLNYRIPMNVPEYALVGETRMRIQLRDSYQDLPQSCLIDNVTGTTDVKLNVVPPSGLTCHPAIISPYDGESLASTNMDYVWNPNNLEVSNWKLKISNGDSEDHLPVYFEQSFTAERRSAQVLQLPQNGENLLVELSWQVGGRWYSTKTYNRAMDVYCHPAGVSDVSYYIQSLSTRGAQTNISYLSGDSPEEGYCKITGSSITVTSGSSFTLDFSESAASSCAYTKVWIDWNGNGSFADPDEAIYESGIPETCTNNTYHTLDIHVPAKASSGTKRMRIRTGNSWLSPLEPCNESGEITTYDLDIEVRSASQPRLLSQGNVASSSLNLDWDLKCRVWQNSLYINVSGEDVSAITHLSIYTVDGCLTKSLNGYDTPLYIGDLPAGIYVVTVKKSNGQVYSTKFVK